MTRCQHCETYNREGAECCHYCGRDIPPQGGTQREETLTSSDGVGARERSYTYDDMLAAWIAGKKHERQVGWSEDDAPDFATWIKLRAPTAKICGDAGTEREPQK